ncbi:MAG: hydrogenase iron-sulfur subunit [Bacteroidales bacterium]|nr:hydrogenase iron-sulfur subunit [Bacteroidales bacterium]
MAKRLGAYVCEGCRIGASVDVEKLCSNMNAEQDVVFCKSHQALCSPEGIREIVSSSNESSLDGILLAACGRGTKDGLFSFQEDLTTERVNLRELVAWAMDPYDEDTQMAAGDYTRMGLEGLRKNAGAMPFFLDNISNDILVVGGGVSGLKAAAEGAANGYKIHLVERNAVLGGWAAKWDRQIPFDEPFDQLREPVVYDLIKTVQNNEKIAIYLNTSIEKIGGQPGDFNVRLRALSGTQKNANGDTKNVIELKTGSVVVATGWEPYRPLKKPFYGLGEIPGVITSVDLEERIREKSLGKTESIMFLQCAGSRDQEHLPYCSSVCCGISLKQAKYVRDRFPDAIVYIVYKDIRTPGFLEDFYKNMQDDINIVFIKGNVVSVASSLNDKILVEIDGAMPGEQVQAEVEQLVLATGMVPNATDDLRLEYRQGNGLPELKYEFPDSHFICFPYETRRTGIYAAGGIRAPLDIPSAMDDGSGAMMKAIQMIESARRGESVHPRAGDRSYPELYMERCTDCKRCTEECPFGTYDETPEGTPVVHPNRCRRCGICLGSCPERVINFADYSINGMSAKIKAVEVPDEFEEKPRVLVFVCENDALPALEMAVRKKLKINPYVRIIPVRCLGSINRVWISDALSKGYDGILQIGCQPGENYQCHFIHGSELSEQRSEIYEETLSSMMLEPERIKTKFVEITDYQKVIQYIDDYMEELELIGPNPFKDM